MKRERRFRKNPALPILKETNSFLQVKDLDLPGGCSFFMNTNEECLLLFLKNPGRIDKTTSELNNFIFSSNDNIINREFAMIKTSNPIRERSALICRER